MINIDVNIASLDNLTCVSERSSSYIFTLKNFRAPDGNRTHNRLITVESR